MGGEWTVDELRREVETLEREKGLVLDDVRSLRRERDALREERDHWEERTRFQQDRAIALAERVDTLEKRLEIDHCYRLVDGQLVKTPLEPGKRDRYPDGIECRDATIALLMDELKLAAERVAGLTKAAGRLADVADDSSLPVDAAKHPCQSCETNRVRLRAAVETCRTALAQTEPGGGE